MQTCDPARDVAEPVLAQILAAPLGRGCCWKGSGAYPSPGAHVESEEAHRKLNMCVC